MSDKLLKEDGDILLQETNVATDYITVTAGDQAVSNVGGLTYKSTGGPNNIQAVNPGNVFSQTISGHSGELSSVAFNCYRSGTATDFIYIEIRESTQAGTLLATSNQILGSSFTGNGSSPIWRNFILPTPITLSPSTTYWILVITTRVSTDAVNYVGFRYTTVGTYAGGEEKTAAGASAGAAYDLDFELVLGVFAPTVTTATQNVTAAFIASGSTATAPSSVGHQFTSGTIAATSAATAPSSVAHTVTTGTIAAGSAVMAPTLVDHIFTGATIISGSAVFALTVALTVTSATIASASQAFSPAISTDQAVTGASISSGSALFDPTVAHQLWAIVDSVGGGGNAVSGATTATANMVGADLLHLSVFAYGAVLDAGDVSDSESNTYVLVDSATYFDVQTHYVFVCEAPIVSSSMTATVTLPGSPENVRMVFIGIAGAENPTATDTHDGDRQNFTTTISAGSTTPTVPNALVISSVFFSDGGATSDPTPDDGSYSQIGESSPTNLFVFKSEQSDPASATNPTFTCTDNGGSSTVTCINVAFRPAEVGAEPTIIGVTISSTSVATAPSTVDHTLTGAHRASTTVLYSTLVALEITGATRASTSTVTAPTLVDHIFTGATIISGSAATAPSLLTHNVTGATIGSTVALSPPTVSIPTQEITGATIAAGSSTFAPSTELAVTGASISTGSQAFAPFTSVTLTSGTITSTAALFGPSFELTVTGATRASTVALFAPSTATVVTTGTISSTAATFSPAIELVVTEGTIGSTSNTFAPTVALDGVIVTNFIPPGALVNPPAVVAEANITNGTIAAGSTTFAPATALAVSGATIASTSTVAAPSSLALNITGSTVVSTTSVHPPAVVVHVEVAGPTIAAGSTTFAPALIPVIEVETGTIAAGSNLFDPAVQHSIDVDILVGTVVSTAVLYPPHEVGGIPVRIRVTNESIASCSVSFALHLNTVVETLVEIAVSHDLVAAGVEEDLRAQTIVEDGG